MKIGIVTQCLIANYGGLLQNYALQQALRNLGHTPVTFDLLPEPKDKKKYILSLIKDYLYRLLNHKTSGVFFHSLGKRKPHIDAFVKANYSLTKRLFSLNSKLCIKEGFDAIIVGSDQVWRRAYNEKITDSFIGFASELKIKRIAYAASFGINELEYNDHELAECKQLLRKFDAISVREKSGIDICKKYFDANALLCLDPTLLHAKEKYQNICDKIPENKDKFAFAYVLDSNPDLHDKITAFANTKNLKLKIAGCYENVSLSIEEWLANFRDASYIITDSFHGTVFSIIFQKPFVSIVNEGRGAERFTSLLSQLDLMGRLTTNDFSNFNDQQINWSQVNNLLDKKREESLDFLRRALDK